MPASYEMREAMREYNRRRGRYLARLVCLLRGHQWLTHLTWAFGMEVIQQCERCKKRRTVWQ